MMFLTQLLTRHMLSDNQHVSNLTSSAHAQLLKPEDSLKEWADAPQHLVYFFAPWCTVCALSQPSLDVFTTMKPNTQVIMVALDWDNPQAVEDFKQKHQFDLPTLLGDQTLKRQWQVDAYPSYYFIDSQGRVTSKDRGLVTLPGLLARSI
ncbi:redoxin domain-containing protein [Psychrobium sp. 1_MG-2023]|uniref:TlpA family protein disulfide reductase n=1 Tax=Psychrobium sp. 1_MG-2023 TaxID=3062624 RepID=UPI002733C8F8|nr:redoxin domain-containing protein [Psychrobium sp. 1_MG-2023]MDP2561601.1 thioredoxin-like domain-containing protein [Psychrobium sp. 1_MG-2023]